MNLPRYILAITFIAYGFLLSLGPQAYAAESNADHFAFPCKLLAAEKGRILFPDHNLEGADFFSGRVVLMNENQTIATYHLSKTGAFINLAKTEVTCKGKQIEIWSQLPVSNDESVIKLRYQNGALELISSIQRDPYAADVEKAKKLLSTGDVLAALKIMNTVMYPQHYWGPDTAQEVLEKGHPIALKHYQQGNLKKAVNTLGKVLDFYSGFADMEKQNTTPESLFIRAKNDYGFFLLENNQAKEAEEILAEVVKLAPDRAVAHLNYADCLWALGKKQKAVSEYKEYARSIQKKKWPPQVQERCPECKP